MLIRRADIARSSGKNTKLDMKKLRKEYGEICAERKKEFLEYAEIKKNMNQYLIARKNLEMLYQQEEEKNEKEGRRSRTRNSHSQNEL